MKRGYKVVGLSIKNSKIKEFHSCMGWGSIYKIGEKTYPKTGYGPLAVFTSYEDAERFAHHYESILGFYLTIFRCEYERSNKKKLYTPYFEEVTRNDECPDGTDFAKWVKLKGISF